MIYENMRKGKPLAIPTKRVEIPYSFMEILEAIEPDGFIENLQKVKPVIRAYELPGIAKHCIENPESLAYYKCNYSKTSYYRLKRIVLAELEPPTVAKLVMFESEYEERLKLQEKTFVSRAEWLRKESRVLQNARYRKQAKWFSKMLNLSNKKFVILDESKANIIYPYLRKIPELITKKKKGRLFVTTPEKLQTYDVQKVSKTQTDTTWGLSPSEVSEVVSKMKEIEKKIESIWKLNINAKLKWIDGDNGYMGMAYGSAHIIALNGTRRIESLLSDTIPHEYAHLVFYGLGLKNPLPNIISKETHGEQFQNILNLLKGEAKS
jgi:hypothetical protein